jgi:predicted GNAT family acetyltransferase
MTHIQHQPDRQRFVLDFDHHQAVLEYALDTSAGGVSIIDFHHTYVPAEFRGKGFAEKLVRTGFAWAKEQGYEIRASCWYAAKFLRK